VVDELGMVAETEGMGEGEDEEVDGVVAGTAADAAEHSYSHWRDGHIEDKRVTEEVEDDPHLHPQPPDDDQQDCHIEGEHQGFQDEE